jgi:hypothetical protein
MELRGAVIEYVGQQFSAFQGEIPYISEGEQFLYRIMVNVLQM